MAQNVPSYAFEPEYSDTESISGNKTDDSGTKDDILGTDHHLAARVGNTD